MAGIGEIKVPLTYEVTDASKAVLKSLILEVLQSDEVKALIRAEVTKALNDATQSMRMNYDSVR